VLFTAHPARHAFRLVINLIYIYAFILSFSFGSLTVIYSLSYTSSFFMILLSALILKENISKERLAAVAIGMIGVIVAMRPAAGVFEWVSILVLFATFLGALNKILMRRLAATEHSLAIAIYPNIMMILVMAPILIGSWKVMTWEHWGLFAIVGGLTAIGQYAIAQALRFTQASTLAPIDYSTFFWVVSLDFLWWNKTPDIYTIAGAFIIVASNFYILYRTRREEDPAQKVIA
jgi:drug/metabolite transporter (DMT)-like permease